MSFVLFVLGLVAAAAGILMIGFGIPINEFSLGNTLIIAGTTALASGLIVVGLSIVARQLSKIAELLLSRPAGPATSRSSDMLEPAGGARMPSPRSALPAEAPPRMAAPSPSFDLADEMPPAPAPRSRVPGFGAPPAPPSPAPAAGAPETGQRNWRPPGMRQPAPPSAEPSVRPEPSIGAPERPQRPAQEPAFDAIWPPDRRSERAEPDFRSEPAPAPAAGPGPRLNGDATHREPPPSRPAESAPVSVLKSGVVDGMAYTLYTDGSIEAELAQGVVRFGSIEELRNHLEKGA